AAAVRQAVERSGLTVVEIALPDLRLAGSASVLAIMAEASAAWQAELEADPDGFGPRVRAALTARLGIQRSAYLEANRARARVCARVSELFEQHELDAIALPTVPVTATPAGQERVSLHGRERAVESLQSEFTSVASLTGQPALSLPCGTGDHGLP